MSTVMSLLVPLGMVLIQSTSVSCGDTNEGDAAIVAMLDSLNAAIAEADIEADVRIQSIALYATEENFKMAREVFASDRGNKQLAVDWIPGDPRRLWGSGTGITWAVDITEGSTASGLSSGGTATAIRKAMETWQGVQCSEIPLVDYGDVNFDFGIVQAALGFGGSPFIVADVLHAGFLPGDFFDLLRPGGSAGIIGVTFTYVFTSDRATALREVYYNDAFEWSTDGKAGIDVETVALHEAGHALSQAHFGDIFRTPSGKVKFAPRAVMNAAYSGVQREITATDKAGHCSIWANWPNN